MHLVYLRVIRKLLMLWVKNKYNISSNVKKNYTLLHALDTTSEVIPRIPETGLLK